LIVRTLTCSKLTHCLFDFDCKDLNVYEDEQYNFQEFAYRNLIHSKYQPTNVTTNDNTMFRKSIKVDIASSCDKDADFSDKAFLRFFYKPCDGGTVWAYNKKTVSFRNFAEVPSKHGIANNEHLTHTRETREAEEDEENNVDLQKTMWFIIRKK